jgi:hypothetical protein
MCSSATSLIDDGHVAKHSIIVSMAASLNCARKLDFQ